MTFRVNGGIINSQTLTGSLRFFKMTAASTEFRWTVSDGSVNLPVSTSGGNTIVVTIVSSASGPKQFVIAGDFTAVLTTGSKLVVSGTAGGVNDGLYTVSTSSYGAPNTTVTVVEAVPATLGGGGLLSGLFTTYFEVGADRPVPNSAAELALREISKKADIVMIGMDASYASTAIIYFAISTTSVGWGSDTPPYDVPPANTDLTASACAAQMQVAVRALPNATVYITAGAVPPLNTQTPVPSTVAFTGITIVEVPFKLV